MAARTDHLAEVLCFCHGIPQTSGHPLETPGCSSKVTAGNYPSRSRNTPSGPRPSKMAADIYAELAKRATSKADRAKWRRVATIAKANDREHSAQDAQDSKVKYRIRLANATSP